MIERRKLVGGGLLAGASMLIPGVGVAAAQQNDDHATLVRAIDDFKEAVRQGFEVWEQQGSYIGFGFDAR